MSLSDGRIKYKAIVPCVGMILGMIAMGIATAYWMVYEDKTSLALILAFLIVVMFFLGQLVGMDVAWEEAKRQGRLNEISESV